MNSVLHHPTVLVLNRHWQAIDVKTPADAFGMMAAGQASGLDMGEGAMRPVSWKEWITLSVPDSQPGVGTVRGAVRVPTVIVLARYDRVPRRRLKFGLRGLWERDGGICQYTGRRLAPGEGSIDHVMPRSRGGANVWENCVLAHKRVNHRKGSKTVEEAGLRLLKPPRTPREVPVTMLIRNHLGVKDWEPFLAPVSDSALEYRD
jgi:5-methylcytosine-specific restriction endonuclease McrA